MNDDWVETTLGNIAEWRGGMTPSMSNPAYWNSGDIPWISSKEVAGGVLVATEKRITSLAVEETSLRLLPPGSVVVVVRSGILLHTFPVAFVPFECTVNQDVKSASAVTGVDGRFLAYLIEANSEEILQRYRKTGTTVQSVDVPGLLSHRVSLPPLPVQRRIVDLMAHLDNQIANLRLERDAGRGLRKATLSSLLDATHEIPADYDAAFDLAFPAPQASPTSEQAMNDDWVETTLGDCCTITIGRTPPRGDSRYWTQDLTRPFCTIADMNGDMVTPSREGVTELAEAEGKAKRFPAGSLLMSFKLTIGRMGFAACDVFPNEAIAWLDVQDPTLDVRFLSLWLASQDLSTGSGRAVKGNTLNSSSMNAITVPVPPLPVQRRIVDLMAHLDKQIAGMDVEVSTLESLRRQLLASLLSQGVELPTSYDLLLDGVA